MADADLLDYEDEEEQEQPAGEAIPEVKKPTGGYVSIHSSGFRDFLLKPELLRAIVDCGFEHPSEVQHECIPQAILGMDILCQAKSGMGKTAVFVLATLQQLDPVDGQVRVGWCHGVALCALCLAVVYRVSQRKRTTLFLKNLWTAYKTSNMM